MWMMMAMGVILAGRSIAVLVILAGRTKAPGSSA
jgi:hypothetical protein